MGQNESCTEEKLKSDLRPELTARRCKTPTPPAAKIREYPTRQQCCILHKSWHRAQQSGLSIGTRVMMQVYKNDPSVWKVVGLTNASNADIKYDKNIQYLAALFTKALTKIMSKIDRPEAVSEYCRELGRRHVRHVKKGFQTRWWDTFAESLTECVIEWEGGQRCKEALNGWRKLVIFIISEMRAGFYEEKKRLSVLETSAYDNNELPLQEPCCPAACRPRTVTE